MRGHACRRATTLLLLALLSLPVAAAAAEGYRTSYRTGLDAFELGDWPRAVASLREAIEDRPEEAARLPRLFFRRYTPYYYLGMTLAELGDCRAALGAFAESERQGAIQGFSDYSELRERRRACEDRLAADAALEKARAAVARATEAAAKVGELAALPELATVWNWREHSLAVRQEEATRLLAEAKALLAGGSGVDAKGGERAAELASRAYWQLEAIRAEGSQHLVEIRALSTSRRTRLDELARQARSALAGPSELAANSASVARARREVERMVGQVGALTKDATVEDLGRVEGQLGQALEALVAASAPPPRALTRAAAALFAGEYQRVVELLAGERQSSRRATAQARLLLAAARFAQWRLAGEVDGELRELARQDALACRAADPALVPRADFFSPDFVTFFAAAPD